MAYMFTKLGTDNSCGLLPSKLYTASLFYPFVGNMLDPTLNQNCGKCIFVKALNGRHLTAEVVDQQYRGNDVVLLNAAAMNLLQIEEADTVSWYWTLC